MKTCRRIHCRLFRPCAEMNDTVFLHRRCIEISLNKIVRISRRLVARGSWPITSSRHLERSETESRDLIDQAGQFLAWEISPLAGLGRNRRFTPVNDVGGWLRSAGYWPMALKGRRLVAKGSWPITSSRHLEWSEAESRDLIDQAGQFLAGEISPLAGLGRDDVTVLWACG